MYATDDAESFEEIRQLRDLILEVKGSEPPPPIVVVGNKSDLPDEKKVVQFEMAECCCIDWDVGFVVAR